MHHLRSRTRCQSRLDGTDGVLDIEQGRGNGLLGVSWSTS